MTGLLGLIVMYYAAVLLGRNTKKPGPGSYLTLAFLALVQVVLILIKMFTMEVPGTK